MSCLNWLQEKPKNLLKEEPNMTLLVFQTVHTPILMTLHMAAGPQT